MNFVVWSIEAKALINLVAANTRIIIAAVIIEGTLDHILCVFNGCQVAWTETAIDFKKCTTLVVGWILLEGVLNIANVASVDILEVCNDFGLLAAKGA